MVEQAARPYLSLETLSPGTEEDFVVGRLHEGLAFEGWLLLENLFP